MPETSGERATPATQAQAAALQDLLGVHTAQPPHRALLIRYTPPMVLLLVAVAYAAAELWAFGLVFVGLAVTLASSTRSRLHGGCTEVTALGVTILTRGTHRDIAWQDVKEVYPRAAWAPFSALRLTSGTTVSLPGVSDEKAPLLEQARADHATAAASRHRAAPDT